MTFLRHTATKSVLNLPESGPEGIPENLVRSKPYTEAKASELKTVTPKPGNGPAARRPQGDAYGMRINQLFGDAIRDIEEQMRDPRRKRIH